MEQSVEFVRDGPCADTHDSVECKCFQSVASFSGERVVAACPDESQTIPLSVASSCPCHCCAPARTRQIFCKPSKRPSASGHNIFDFGARHFDSLSLSSPKHANLHVHFTPTQCALVCSTCHGCTNAFVSAQRCHKTALPSAKKGAQLCSVFFRDGKGTCCQPPTALRLTLQERPLMLNIVDVVLESVFHF